MKSSIFSFVVFIILLSITGCQDNSITNPLSSSRVNKSTISSGLNNQSNIILDQKISNPERVDDVFLLKGQIQYNFVQIDANSNASFSPVDEVVDLSINGVLIDQGASTGNADQLTINSKSEKLISLSPGNRTDFQEVYNVNGSHDDLQLICNFELNDNGLRLNSASLTSKDVRF